jgi:hypothetical protein
MRPFDAAGRTHVIADVYQDENITVLRGVDLTGYEKLPSPEPSPDNRTLLVTFPSTACTVVVEYRASQFAGSMSLASLSIGIAFLAISSSNNTGSPGFSQKSN